MRPQTRLFLIIIGAFVLIGVFAMGSSGLLAVQGQSSGQGQEHALQVRMMKGHWKVVDAADSTKSLVTAQRGDAISWMPIGSDAYFQFPDSTLFGVYSVSAKAGKKLSLTVSPEAKSGKYTYSIFCLKDAQFATGDSPPVIIIE